MADESTFLPFEILSAEYTSDRTDWNNNVACAGLPSVYEFELRQRTHTNCSRGKRVPRLAVGRLNTTSSWETVKKNSEPSGNSLVPL